MSQAPYHLLSDAAGLRRPITKDWFLQSVEKTPTCWLWKGTTTVAPSWRQGTLRKIRYGAVIISQVDGHRHTTGAHRVAWQLWKGELTRQAHVLHKCDNGLCVNPDHLFLGSWKENMDDMWAKGRHPLPDMAKRPNFNKALITRRAAGKIRQLRAQGMKVKDIVLKVFYHATRTAVAGQSWKTKPQTMKGKTT